MPITGFIVGLDVRWVSLTHRVGIRVQLVRHAIVIVGWVHSAVRVGKSWIGAVWIAVWIGRIGRLHSYRVHSGRRALIALSAAPETGSMLRVLMRVLRFLGR